MTPALKPHPAAELFPMMSDAELDDLAKDIKLRGQNHPIIVHEGQILDGRNRYEACRRAGVEPKLRQWKALDPGWRTAADRDESPITWVLSENLHRRHLTVDQRALIALEASALFAAEAKARQKAAGGDRRSVHAADRLPPRGGKRSEERAPTAAAQAAQTAGVSARSVERARRVQASQPEILSRVRDGSMTLKQAEKAVVQRERMKEVLAYQPPQGRYSVIVADPPWRYDDQLDGSDLARGGVQYPTMSVEEICALKVGEGLATPDCALWLWVTNAFIEEGYRVVREWGFRKVGFLTWRKDRIGAGRYLRNQTEHAILAIRGKPLVQGESCPSVFDAPRRGHSEKPDEAFAIFEQVTPAAPAARLELFARKPREGWRTSGSELTASPSEQLRAGTLSGSHPTLPEERRDYRVLWSSSPAKAARAKKHRPGQDPFTPPFHVQVGRKIYPGLHKDRQTAWDAAAKELGLFKFEVRDDNGVGSDFVDMPPKSKPTPKKKKLGRGAIKKKLRAAENAGAALHREHVERDLAAAAGRRLNGAGWKRSAAKAREEEGTTTCHHCGTDLEDDDVKVGESDFEMVPLCAGCRVRLRADPREFDRHKTAPTAPAQVSLDEAIARTKPPTRPTRKFPLQSGPTEKCTACGAEQGQHAGTRCPSAGAKRRRAA